MLATNSGSRWFSRESGISGTSTRGRVASSFPAKRPILRLVTRLTKNPAAEVHLSFSRTQVARNWLFTLLAIEFALVVADLTLNFMEWVPNIGLRRFFNIAREDSMANWLSSIQSFGIALTGFCMAGLVWRYENTRARPESGHGETTGWSVLGLFFLFAAIDDGARLHERLGPVVRDLATSLSRHPGSLDALIESSGAYSWHWTLLPFFVLVGSGLLIFLWRHSPSIDAKVLLFLAGLSIAGAIGLDYYEGVLRYSAAETILGWERYTVTHFQKVAEELLEMLGQSLFWTAMLQIGLSRIHRLDLEFSEIGGSTEGTRHRRSAHEKNSEKNHEKKPHRAAK